MNSSTFNILSRAKRIVVPGIAAVALMAPAAAWAILPAAPANVAPPRGDSPGSPARRPKPAWVGPRLVYRICRPPRPRTSAGPRCRSRLLSTTGAGFSPQGIFPVAGTLDPPGSRARQPDSGHP